MIGPLGQGFKTDFSGKKIGLIGGGMGIAPLIFLSRELSQENQLQAFWGARSKELLPTFATAVEFPYAIATEDGSSGRKGLVTEFSWNSFLKIPKVLRILKALILFACGTSQCWLL